MANVNMKALLSKLNSHCRRTLESAAGLCLSKTNFDVEIEHWFVRLMEIDNGDFRAILTRFDADPAKALRQLNTSLDTFRTGNGKVPQFSTEIMDATREACRGDRGHCSHCR